LKHICYSSIRVFSWQDILNIQSVINPIIKPMAKPTRDIILMGTRSLFSDILQL
jgi:hypothetical protein